MRLLLLASLLGMASSLHAGSIFPWRKAEKPDPKTRVPELIRTLQAERDEGRRSAAAVELRGYDTAQFPDVVPALIAALLTDTKPGVRIDAAQSLGKIRPVSQAAGEALEQALEKDPSMRVRLQARSVLLGYQWAGYRSAGKKPEMPAVATTPVPAAAPAAEKRSGLGGLFLPPIRTTAAPPPRTVAAPPAVGATTAEPPLAAPDAPPAAPAIQTITAKPLPPAVTPPAAPPSEGPILP